jgi:hypothetical protein
MGVIDQVRVPLGVSHFDFRDFSGAFGTSNSAETSPSREDSDDRVRNHYILVASRSDAKLLD